MKRDYTSDTLRTIAALMVVLVHVVADYVNLAMKSDNFNLSFWVSNIVDSFCRICLPIFVMISGMFLLGRTETFRDSYRKRASKILIPLIFWTIIYLVYLVVLRLFAGVDPDADTLLKSVILGQPFYHMWYLYMLIGLYFVTPLINLVIPKVSRQSLWVTAIVFLIFGIVHNIYNLVLENNLMFLLWFTDYLGYFLFGYLIRDCKARISSSALVLFYIISAALISVLSYYTASQHNNLYFYGPLSPLVALGSLSFFSWFRRFSLNENIFSKISHLTFGIYLIHAGVLHLLAYLLKTYDIHMFDNIFIGIPVKFTFALFISLSISWLFYKSPILRRTV
jgi:surface polysaccharide O-acyltransferase-like enzyme